MARTYKRDARGRFAGGGGGSGGGRKSAKLPAPTKRTATGKTQRRQGLLTQRAAVSAAQAKLKSKDPSDRSLTGQLSLRAQKAAVTRAKNKLAAAQQTGRIRLSGRDGVIRRGKAKGGAKNAAVTPPASKPARKAKTPAQVEAQANRLLDRLKGQRMSGQGGGARSYTIRDRIDRVNAAAKQVLPRYRHNPLRKGSSISGATRDARRRANNARYNAALDNWNRGGRR